MVAAFIIIATTIQAQSDSTKGSFLKPIPRNYEVKQAFEAESLFPMFFTGGYHVGLGYNVWKNLEVYTFLELHTFEIEQASTGLKQNIHSTDFGGAISYQFFFGRHIYLQPGFHIHLPGDNSAILMELYKLPKK